MADDILAEAIVRVEHKVDALLNHFKIITQPMHFPGQACPSCKAFIDYQVDVAKGVVVRKCKCSSGKTAPLIPLVPIQPGAVNGTTTTSQDAASIAYALEPKPKNGSRG